MPALPSLDSKCGKHFRFRDLVECGETFHNTHPDNVPKSDQTYEALRELTRTVLDPVSEYFGKIDLAYGLSCPDLYRHIDKRITPSLDQHASYELNSKGISVCARGGAAADFVCIGISSLEIAQWIARSCGFDRIYFYGVERPIHVSVGPENSGHIVLMRRSDTSERKVPLKLSIEKFMTLDDQSELVINCSRNIGNAS